MPTLTSPLQPFCSLNEALRNHETANNAACWRNYWDIFQHELMKTQLFGTHALGWQASGTVLFSWSKKWTVKAWQPFRNNKFKCTKKLSRDIMWDTVDRHNCVFGGGERRGRTKICGLNPPKWAAEVYFSMKDLLYQIQILMQMASWSGSPQFVFAQTRISRLTQTLIPMFTYHDHDLPTMTYHDTVSPQAFGFTLSLLPYLDA